MRTFKWLETINLLSILSFFQSIKAYIQFASPPFRHSDSAYLLIQPGFLFLSLRPWSRDAKMTLSIMMASFQLTLSEEFSPYDCQAEKGGILSKYIPHLGAWSIAGFQFAPSYFWVVCARWDIFLEEDSLFFAFKLSQPPRDSTIFEGRNGASIDFTVNSEYFSCDLSYGEKFWKTSLTVSVWSKGTLFWAVKGGICGVKLL